MGVYVSRNRPTGLFVSALTNQRHSNVCVYVGRAAEDAACEALLQLDPDMLAFAKARAVATGTSRTRVAICLI